MLCGRLGLIQFMNSITVSSPIQVATGIGTVERGCEISEISEMWGVQPTGGEFPWFRIRDQPAKPRPFVESMVLHDSKYRTIEQTTAINLTIIGGYPS